MNKPDIEDILMAFGDEAVDSLFKDEKVTLEAFTKAKQALYHRLAAEAVEASWSKRDNHSSAFVSGKAIPLSKLKAIMEIKE